jgi:isoleucyl-tRNA synthetase
MVGDGNSRTPTIDKLINSSQLAAVGEVLQVVTGVFIGVGDLIQRLYNRFQTSLMSALLLLAAVILVYLGIAIMLVINRLPLLGTIVESIGIVMTGVFCYRNLWTSSKRQATFDRIIDYRQAISGKKPNLVKIVDSVEDPQDVANIPQIEPASLPIETSTPQPKSNGVDELRYLFLASQVELIDDPSKIKGLPHQTTSESGNIGVVTAEGAKCDRCWNYSPTIGQNSEHPLVCDRCVDALAGDF